MSTEIDRLFFTIDADMTALKSKWSEAEQGGRNTATSISTSFGGVTRTLTQVAAAFGVAFSAGALASFTQSMLASTAAIGNQAKQMGISTTALQAYRIAAVQSGASADEGDMAIQRLTRSIGEQAVVIGPARKAFNDLGLSAADLAGGTESVLQKVATKLLGIGDATQRATIEVALFGRSGQTTEKLLAMWADQTALDNIKKYGPIIDENLIKTAEKADIAWNLFWLNFRAGLVKAAGALPKMGQDIKDAFIPPAGEPYIVTPEGQVVQQGIGFGAQKTNLQKQFQQWAGNGPALQSSLTGPQPHWNSDLAAQAAQRNAQIGAPTSAAQSTPNMDKFLADQKLALELATDTTAQRIRDDAVVKAANAAIADSAETEKRFVSSVEDAVKVLGAQRAALIGNSAAATSLGESFAKAFAGADITSRARGLPTSRAAVQAVPITTSRTGAQEDSLWTTGITNLPNETQKAAGAAAQAGLSSDEAQIDSAMRRNEAEAKYMESLQGEVDLAGLLPDEREKELALLQAKKDFGDVFVQQNKDQITGLISLRQQHQLETDAEAKAADAIGTAFQSALSGGRDVIGNLGKALAGIIEQLFIIEPLEQAIRAGMSEIFGGGSSGGSSGGSFFGNLFGSGPIGDSPSLGAKGMAWAGGVRYAAMGDVLSGPTLFSSPTGPVIGGEAGDEALMPLVRGPSGHLGVRASGGSGPSQTVNINQTISISPDVSAVARSEIAKVLPTIAASAVSAVQQANRRT